MAFPFPALSRRRCRMPLLAAAAVSSALLLSSCTERAHVFSSPYNISPEQDGGRPTAVGAGPQAPPPAGAQTPLPSAEVSALGTLRALYLQRHPEWKTFRAEADVTANLGDGSTQSFSANVLVRLPEDVRLRGSKGALGTIFEIIARGDDVQIYFNRDGMLFRGKREDLGPEAGVLRLLGPGDVMKALLACRDLGEKLATRQPLRVVDKDAHWIVFWEDAKSGAWQVWAVRKADALVRETILGQRGGATRARIEYWSYSLADAEPVPQLIDVHFKDENADLSIEVEKFDKNLPMKDKVFVAPETSREKTYPLSRLRLDPIGSGQ